MPNRLRNEVFLYGWKVRETQINNLFLSGISGISGVIKKGDITLYLNPNPLYLVFKDIELICCTL